jgi:putative transferase (TIGR04331 family)
MMNKLNDNKQSPRFLATTALEEFWDTSKPLLFLGEWCRRYSRKFFWEPLSGEVLVSPWHDIEQLHKAYQYVYDVYERLLPCLGKALNSTHKVNHSIRYWRIFLGPWLLYYIPVIYDRYRCLRTALDNYPDVTSALLAEEAWVTPCDAQEYVQLLKEDSYNLQLYSRILKLMGYDFPQKMISVAGRPFVPFERNVPRWKSRLSKFLDTRLTMLCNGIKAGHSIIFRSSYFSPLTTFLLIIKTFGRIWPVLGWLTQTPCSAPNMLARLGLQDVLPAENDFERLLNHMLPLDVPQSFIEGFDALRDAAEHTYPLMPKAIFSSAAWHFDEVFKQWAAVSAENGTLLLGVQHGGNYGSLAHHPSEDHEITITDRYYSWGWERSNHGAQVTPWFASKLVGRKPLHADNQKAGILFLPTSAPRYLIQFPHTPDRFNQYLLWQWRFLASIDSRLLLKFRVRFHAEDFGWDIAQRWQASYPEIRVETWDSPFIRSLQNCRLYVCDHLATTFLEALSADKPTILFWNPAINELRPEAQPYYDRLRAAGILYDTPEAAAGEVQVVYDNVMAWWNDPARQEARRIFCNRFAWTSSNAVKEWTGEFKRISKDGIMTR